MSGKSQMDEAKRKLTRLMQKAHAGERAAALAYRGHVRALTDASEIAAVRKIEDDEWRHRAELLAILAGFGASPIRTRELLFQAIGVTVALGCRFCGRFVATFFAGVLENSNVCEYREASKLALQIGDPKLASVFRQFELTEADHESVLLEMIARHPMRPLFAALFGWGNQPAKSAEAAVSR
jgi:demethoxyubiquinone hydroxylase (CLK1/Coq7/Cat5 family)